MKNVDSENIRQFPDSKYYLHDGETIYYGKNKYALLKEADIKTFFAYKESEMNYQYMVPLAADKNAFYLYDKQILYKAADKTRILAPYNSGHCAYLFTDSGRIFKINNNKKAIEPVEADIDVKNLEIVLTNDKHISPHYFKDKAGVYFYDLDNNKFIRLSGADPKTFEAHAIYYSPALFWAKDNQRIYVYHKLIDKADYKSFTYIGWIYAKDKNHVFVLYSDWYIIPAADPQTFDIVKGRGIDAVDKNHSYFGGKIVH